MSVFKVNEGYFFYLQDAYKKDWIENSMIFLEVEDVEACFEHIASLDLTNQYEGIRYTNIIHANWGKEFHLLDPAGVLWHFGNFEN